MSRQIGPREQALRDARKDSLSKDPVIRQAQLDHAKAQTAKKPKAPASAKPEESPLTKKKKAKAKTRAKAAVKTAAQKTATPKRARRTLDPNKDRSPLAVGTFIVAAGTEGRKMVELEKEFGIDAHPMRTKIFVARHEHGFTIEYDTKAKAYVGLAPKVAAA